MWQYFETSHLPRFKDSLFNTVGHRQTELLLSLGQLLSSKEALEIGLVDKVVLQDDALNHAKTELKKWLAIPGNIIFIVLIHVVLILGNCLKYSFISRQVSICSVCNYMERIFTFKQGE